VEEKVRIHYYLQIDDSEKIRCLKCGRTLCDASENYKEHVPRAEVWPDEIPGERPHREDTLLVYYEYYCPGCFTLLDVEMMEKDSAPLWDIQIRTDV
jgi:acetone carboxylase gamma subunit